MGLYIRGAKGLALLLRNGTLPSIWIPPGELRVIAFLADFAVVDRIINHLKLTFVADRPPPPQIAYQEVLVAAETPAEYFS